MRWAVAHRCEGCARSWGRREDKDTFSSKEELPVGRRRRGGGGHEGGDYRDRCQCGLAAAGDSRCPGSLGASTRRPAALCSWPEGARAHRGALGLADDTPGPQASPPCSASQPRGTLCPSDPREALPGRSPGSYCTRAPRVRSPASARGERFRFVKLPVACPASSLDSKLQEDRACFSHGHAALCARARPAHTGVTYTLLTEPPAE